jgi:tetratricopeptide (TPR) repeat protein
MSFWRREVIESALDQETRRYVDEQMEWIAREPDNPRPYYHLAQLYRTQRKQDEALALLLEAVSKDEAFAEAHVALTELYAVRGDYGSAWRHARAAERHGNRRGVELLQRHGVKQPGDAPIHRRERKTR